MQGDKSPTKTTETGPECCVWQADDEGTYETSCGQAFVFTCDGPRENGARFCMYCGKRLEARVYVDQTAAQ